jgi:uncharacterized membrane protein
MASAAAPRFTPQAWVAFIVCTLIWGSTWFVIRTQLGEVPPSWSVTWRFALGAAVMFGLCVARGKSLALSARQHGFAILVAVSQFVLNFNLVYRAEQYLTSGLVSLTFTFLLVTNTLLSALFLGQRVAGRFILGSAIGLAGVALLFAPDLGQPGGDQMGLGLALAFGGVFSASVANVLQAIGSRAGLGDGVGRADRWRAGLGPVWSAGDFDGASLSRRAGLSGHRGIGGGVQFLLCADPHGGGRASGVERRGRAGGGDGAFDLAGRLCLDAHRRRRPCAHADRSGRSAAGRADAGNRQVLTLNCL